MMISCIECFVPEGMVELRARDHRFRSDAPFEIEIVSTAFSCEFCHAKLTCWEDKWDPGDLETIPIGG